MARCAVFVFFRSVGLPGFHYGILSGLGTITFEMCSQWWLKDFRACCEIIFFYVCTKCINWLSAHIFTSTPEPNNIGLNKISLPDFINLLHLPDYLLVITYKLLVFKPRVLRCLLVVRHTLYGKTIQYGPTCIDTFHFFPKYINYPNRFNNRLNKY